MRFSLLSVLTFAVCLAVALCDRAKIVSCPGCKLNALPKLKQFLRSEELKTYNDLSISWERGKNPDLFIYNDAGELREKHDLSKMEVDAIKALLVSKGFAPQQQVSDL